MLKQVGFTRTEATAEKHPFGITLPRDAQQLQEAVLDLRLPGAEHCHGIQAWDPSA